MFETKDLTFSEHPCDLCDLSILRNNTGRGEMCAAFTSTALPPTALQNMSAASVVPVSQCVTVPQTMP